MLAEYKELIAGRPGLSTNRYYVTQIKKSSAFRQNFLYSII